MTIIEGKLCLELHDLTFLKDQNNQVSSKANFMPWLESGFPSSSASRMSNAQPTEDSDRQNINLFNQDHRYLAKEPDDKEKEAREVVKKIHYKLYFIFFKKNLLRDEFRSGAGISRVSMLHNSIYS